MPEPVSNPRSPEPREPSDGWERACAGILRAEFGRRRSRALSNALIQLAAEEAWAEAQTERAPGWLERIRRCFRFPRRLSAKGIAGLALVTLGITAAAWVWRPFHFGPPVWQPDSVCTVYDALNVRWMPGSNRPRVGEILRAGTLRLESGVLELEFAREEKIAIEGPAQVELTSARSLRLESGKLAAYVPRSGRGFIVDTSSARFVDLGTQFGVRAGDGVSEVGVFEGRVRVIAEASGKSVELTPNMALSVNAAGGMRPASLSLSAFPQIGRAITMNPENCRFDEFDRLRRGGIPVAFGFWSGPAYTVTGPTTGVRPYKGAGMLRFLDPSPGAAMSSGKAVSEVWQLMDVRPFKELLAEGGSGKLSALFNRARDGGREGGFGLTLAAFQGRPEEAPVLWSRKTESAVALLEKEFTPDTDPATWEEFEISVALPPETDFLVLGLRATGNGGAPSFSGHFADNVTFKLRVPLRASSQADRR